MLHLLLGVLLACQAADAAEVELPAPAGPFKTGRTSFHWQDAARDELETSAADDKRELMVHLFYPADADATGERAVYVPDADAMRGPWNPEQLARITALRAYSLESPPPAAGDARFPVAIFSPGGGMKGLTYHVLLEDLASHGWVVAAIDPPYNARAVRLPDGRVLGGLKPAEKGWPEPKSPEDFQRFYIERIGHWARDVSFVIDRLVELDAGDGPLARRLDLARGVGACGHSRGGQAASAVRVVDERVRGGINLDGTTPYAVLPIKPDAGSGAQPFLWIQQQLPPPPSDEQLKRAGRTRAEYDAEVEKLLSGWRRQLGEITEGALRVTLARQGLTHIDFSDEPFWDGNMTADSRPGKLQTIAETRAWILAFFDATVCGRWAALKKLAEAPENQSAGITVETFGKLWQ
ncbi:MAG: hypothetical protein K2Y37_26790 [Pirellulales bacterium]|nr:hypothetical protein [Pirellulales bacterium]